MQNDNSRNKSSLLIGTVLLSLLGIGGNYLHITLFFGIDFIFGSIAALVALRLFGITSGVTVAVIAGAYTYIRWGHPYAMVIFALEALVVGILLRRRISSLVLADILYWLFLGMPLIWFFYHHVIGMNETQTTLILLKQPINGIANAIIATYSLYLISDRLFTTNRLSEKPRIHLKELLFTTFLAITYSMTLALVVFQSHTTQSDYEKSLSSEMALYLDFIEHRITNKPGKLNINLIKQDYHLYKYKRDLILLNNINHKPIFSTLPDKPTQAILDSGTRKQLANNLTLWMPERNGQPLMIWWKQAFYMVQKPLSRTPDVSVLLLQNSQSIIGKLQSETTRTFMIFLCLIIFSGVISFLLSTLLTRTIVQLTDSTKNVVDKLKTGMGIEWPHSAVSELEQLSQQAQLMSKSIHETFNDANTRSTAIIEASADAVITMNDQQYIESINSATQNMFGYTDEEILEQDFKYLLPESQHHLYDGYLLSLTTNTQNETYSSKHELSGKRKDGSLFPIEMTLTKVNLQNRTIYSVIISDITERKANDKLKQEFISTVSHELRTPLTSIQGAIKLIQARQHNASAEDTRVMMELAERNAHRLAELINDLLDFEKLESEGIEYDIRIIHLDRFLSTIIENTSPMAAQNGVNLVQMEPCHARISADSARLNQVLTNLISNAIKFSSSGSNVEIGCKCEDAQVTIYVADHGEGIADEFKDRIFQRFSQADSSDTRRVQRGTGLGLAISRRMTEDMGGRIEFESQLGKGSTFYVTFALEHE